MSESAVVGTTRPVSDAVRARRPAIEAVGRRAPVDHAPVVVGVDGSRESLNAASFAIREAQLWRRPILMLHAYGRRPRNVHHESAQVVENVVDELVLPDGVAIEKRLVDGDAAAVLLHAAQAASMLVVGRHRSGSGAHLLSGTVSSVLSSHALCPLVVVSGGWHRERYAEGPVVVALDAGPENSHLLSFAFRRAQLSGRPLLVVHPYEHVGLGIRSRQGVDIGALVDGWQAAYPEVSVTMQYAPDNSKAAIAAAWTASLLVVGQPRSLAGADSWLRSVGYAVVRHTIRPVVVVPRKPNVSARTA